MGASTTKPFVSAYTTTRNCDVMGYPYIQSIRSMCEFAQEVVVLDTSNGADKTLENLRIQLEGFPVQIVHEDWDWTVPNHGVLDGQAKARARSLCTGDFLWQFDVDEVVHEDHVGLIPKLCDPELFKDVPLLALPVVEFWGSSGLVRLDVNLWKWRLSINDPRIIHGIPKTHRNYDAKSGLMYAHPGTDGCDYINRVTGDVIPCRGFLSPQFQNIQRATSQAFHEGGTRIVTAHVNEILKTLPGVFHYSWWDIERKIRQYRQFWTGFWPSLYNTERDDRSNPFFPGLTWNEVTDDMIKTKAKELETGCAGHIFHTPWNGRPTFGIHVDMDHPKMIKEWIQTPNDQEGV